MDEWLRAPLVIGIFVLRFVVPLAVTLMVGYWLRRLGTEWQAESEWQRRQTR